MTSAIPERIAALREEMKSVQIAAYIITGSDPHLSEYPATRWESREWISGFTGSAGTVVITKKRAGLWTDSRYFLQAEKELKGTGIELFKMRMPGTPSIQEFLLSELKTGETVGIDGETYSAAEVLELAEKLQRKALQLDTSHDLIDSLWNNRPAIPSNPLFEMPEALCGMSVHEKLNKINHCLHTLGADSLLLTALDEVAWTFNIRGTDVVYNPVAISYGFVSEKESVLFVPPGKITHEIATHLKKEGVSIADYSLLPGYLAKRPKGEIIFLDKNKTNITLYNSISDDCKIMEGITPANHLKSQKNETEIAGFHSAMVKDGVALTKFYIWLENELAVGKKVTELSAAEKLTSLRAEQPLYIMDSFETICGYGANGASPHYSATPESNTVIKPEGLLLIDSGAQYMDGTTDITRTIALGKPSEQMKKDYTRVLKGHISLANCKFPVNTRGSQLDILARKALWDAGINYLHGTGHGIGHCLNVHEGPQSIRMEENSVTLKPGMVISNEPAMYRKGEYGIRTENLILVKEDRTTEFGEFLSFETLTLCYIDTSLVDVSMLSADERIWLNNYHQMVYDKLSPHLSKEEAAWLKEKTKTNYEL
ncbi:aminopeptidase P family protein [Parabacteroides sp. OttesenSCG-928-G07]|nr:aminopeptidase P family protein [Parabacteroides sp. OttesenSCG-928-G07]